MAVDLRREAKGRICQVQIPNVCQGGTETTILAHVDVPGWNVKADDTNAAWACWACHLWLGEGYIVGCHNEAEREFAEDDKDYLFKKAVIRTQKILKLEGKL